MDHIRELRRRLFWIAGFVIAASAAAFPLQHQIIQLLTAPLAGEQLYYITPVGGFSFLIKLCTYVGIAVAIPVIVYHLYKYLEPLMASIKKSVLLYVGASTLLAACGMVFAYVVSLPAALHFLTNINIGNVEAMLTVDSYLTFVMTYLLGAALLFQIPLILLIVNGITPLPPKRLTGMQRYVVLGAFILAAIISPTPDIINQSILAVPVVAMYQVGVAAVWLQQRHGRRAVKAGRMAKQAVQPTMSAAPVVAPEKPANTIPREVAPQIRSAAAAKSVDGFAVGVRKTPVLMQSSHNVSGVGARPARPGLQAQQRVIRVPVRSVDGIVRVPAARTAIVS